MIFIKGFVKRKVKELLDQSGSVLIRLDKEWNRFLEQDTYLIYEDKSNFLHLATNETKAPWYLFWNFKLKSKLKANSKRIRGYLGDIEIYNKNFVIQKKTE